MHKKEFIPNALTLSIFSILVFTPNISSSLVINEKLNGKISTYDWQAINGACLTAGDATSSSSTIPACIGLNYYSGKKQVGGKTGQLLDGTPDNSGEGALRLTNGDTTANGSNGNNQSGAVYSNFDFPSNQGVNITFYKRGDRRQAIYLHLRIKIQRGFKKMRGGIGHKEMQW